MFTRNMMLRRIAQVRRNALTMPPSCLIQPRIQALIMAKSRGNATVRHLLAAAYRDLRDGDFFLVVGWVNDVTAFERDYLTWMAERRGRGLPYSMSAYTQELAARLRPAAHPIDPPVLPCPD